MRLPADNKIIVHGHIQMKRELAWLVSFYDNFRLQEQVTVTDHFNKIKIHLKPGSTGEGIHTAFAHLLETGGRRENLEITPNV
jgi:hypothetical protein